MFNYPDIDENSPIAEQRKLALVRRTDKLQAWLSRPDYAEYQNENSTDRLLKLIDLVIYALKDSLPAKDWKPFYLKLNNLKKMLKGLPEFKDKAIIQDEQENYEPAIAYLKKILVDYGRFVIANKA